MEIKRIITENVNEAVEFAYGKCTELKNRSYPLYKNRKEMETEFLWSAKEENGALYGVYDKGCVQGVLSAFRSPCSRYVQTTGIYAENETCCRMLLERLRQDFCGDKCAVGIPWENEQLKGILEAFGYSLREDSIDFRIETPVYYPVEANTLGENDVEEYLEFHKMHFEEYYWKESRIRWGIKNWDVYYLKDDKIYSGIFAKADGTQAEIFGMYAKNAEDAECLVKSVVSALFEKHSKVKNVVFMAQAENEIEKAAAVAAGFVSFGRYCLYTRTL